MKTSFWSQNVNPVLSLPTFVTIACNKSKISWVKVVSDEWNDVLLILILIFFYLSYIAMLRVQGDIIADVWFS